MAITVVVGPPCAGKSTWIAAQRTAGDVVIDFDQLAQALGSTSPHAAPPAVREVAFAARKSAIGRVLRGVDADAWLIHTNPWPGQLARYEEAGAAVVVLDPGMETCLARASADGRPEGTEDAIRQWYDAPPLTDLEKRRTAVQTKDCPAKVKAAGPADGLAEGEFIALVSVFGNVDSAGDKMVQGAFTDTLAEWASRGDPIPTIWSHDWGDPFSHIGIVKEAQQVGAGLLVRSQIEDLDTNPTAAQVYRLIKGRRVTQFSFAYDVVEGAWVEGEDEQGNPTSYYELRKVKLYEVGPTLVGANQETQLLAAKAATLARGAKAGRVLSQKNFEALTSAYEAIGEVLTSATPEKAGATAGKTSDTEVPGQPGPAADGDQPSAQPDTPPAQDTPADDQTTDSSTEDETTPDPREAPDQGAAKAGTDSLRLRHALQLLELEATLTE
ncbi:HK97 family phage prohead protease [Streptomyces sp. 796.1]|uniref:HK97 family phage prohead protease n=1 Tax=Streptomyces sp. 796.1 TaxID=3163029 RepID=UPI0039C94AF6